MTTADHAALWDAVEAAGKADGDAFDAMWHTLGAPDAEWQAAFDAWRAAADERTALIRAGILITLGPLEGET